MINLGSIYKDKYSGFTGVAVASHHYINGCTRVTLQPPVDENMKLPDDATFDEPQLVLVSQENVQRDNSTGGPEKYSDVRRY